MRTIEKLISEFSSLKSRTPLIRKKVDGRDFVERLKRPQPEDIIKSEIHWINKAHNGTLDKLENLFHRDGEYETFELLSIARNMFENLVWTRLFSINNAYGIVFYAHLIRGQKEHNNGFIQKLEEEAELFETAAQIDSEIFDSAGKIFKQHGDRQEKILAFETLRREQQENLDDMIRREFSLCAHQAATNGYRFQAHIINNDIIPRHRRILEDLDNHETSLIAVLPLLLDSKLQKIATTKWNWHDRAKDAGMQKHYRFIYSYTSRLLHSTPTNIITEKALSTEEKILIMDYIVIASSEILNLIDDFSYPGAAKISIINLHSNKK